MIPVGTVNAHFRDLALLGQFIIDTQNPTNCRALTLRCGYCGLFHAAGLFSSAGKATNTAIAQKV